MELKGSKTGANLMRAFAGESQARNRYTYAAGLAQQNNLYVLKEIFTLTAEQEKEHGEIFYKYLSEMEGQEIQIDAGYPVNTSDDIQQQLLYALENESKEADEIYRDFGDIALQEGFKHIAGKFYMISDIERTHAQRFQVFYDLLKEGKLFVSDVKTAWVCLHCGYVLETTNAPQNCPVCDSNQGYFVRLSMSPYEVSNMGEDKNRDLGR